jgi:hypothetical protein
MKFGLTLISFYLFSTSIAFSQIATSQDSLINKISDSLVNAASAGYAKKIRDSVVKKVSDSLFWANLEKTATYPLIINSKWSGVFPVNHVIGKA